MSSDKREPPLVAVVTPVYNGAAFLADALESVQAQTYTNLIHIILDNASTDDTPRIIERFKNARVPIHVTRNQLLLPIQENWNAAVSLVPRTAKYFQILCADDVIMPACITKTVAVAESDPDIEIVGCAYWRHDQISPSSLPVDKTVFSGSEIVRSYLAKKSDDIPYIHGLFRKREEDFESKFFDESLYALDTDACLRAMTRGKFGYVHAPLFRWRRHAGQVTNTVVRENRAQVFEPLILIERWGPRVMPQAEFKSCHSRHLRAIYRHMIAWRVLGRTDLYQHHMALLRERGKEPNLMRFAHSIASWPGHLLNKHVRTFWRKFRRVALHRQSSEAGEKVSDSI